MMDQIIITLVLISIFCNASGQLQCIVCTDCPNVDELDYTYSQRCNGVSPPNTQPTSTTTTTSEETTSPPNTSPTSTTEETSLPPNTSPTSTTEETSLPPNTSPTATTEETSLPPNTSPTSTTEENSSPIQPTPITTSSPPSPPTPTRPPTITLAEENDAIRTNSSHSAETKPPPRILQILSQSQDGNNNEQLSGTHQCFRIVKIVGDVHQVDRGCVVPANTFHETCVRANSGVAPIRCRICQSDDCNDARRNRTTTTSIVLMFTSIISMTFLR